MGRNYQKRTREKLRQGKSYVAVGVKKLERDRGRRRLSFSRAGEQASEDEWKEERKAEIRTRGSRVGKKNPAY